MPDTDHVTPREPFRIPVAARLVVRLVRLVPVVVTVAFAGWALGAAIAGRGAIAAGALAMSLLSLGVAARSMGSGIRPR